MGLGLAVVTASASSRRVEASFCFHVVCGRSVRTAFSPFFMKWPNSPAAMKPDPSSSRLALVRVRVRVRVRGRVGVGVRGRVRV